MENKNVVSSDPEIMEQDNLFGRKSKARRRAKRRAKKLGKSQGLKGKTLKRFARAARQKIRSIQLLKKGKTKKAARVLARGGETSIGRGLRTAVFTPLLPFKKGMKKALARKGITPPKRMRSLVPLFYREIVRKDSYEVSDSVAPIAIGAIITAIIDFFKGKKKAKEDGKQLSPVNEIVADAAMNVTAMLQAKKKKQQIAEGDLRTDTQADKQEQAQMKLVEPLRPVMTSALKRVGVHPPKDIKDLTITFYNRVVNQSNNSYSGLSDSADGDGNKSVLFQTLVPAVIGFLGALKAKKSSGEPMSKTEDFIVTQTERAETGIRGAAQDRAQMKIGGFVLSPIVLIGLAGIIILSIVTRNRAS